MSTCNLCPRACGVDRAAGETGVCGVSGDSVYLARAALHMWEEPCISGESGSGAVFFSGCPLRCVYCQNYDIAHAEIGRAVSVDRLAEIFLELQQKGAANINLVTPTHYTPQIIRAVKHARAHGLHLPVVYNCSGYEKVETLRMLEGIADIYLTDFKYMETEPATRYSHAPDYPQVAQLALAEMVRQVAPKCVENLHADQNAGTRSENGVAMQPPAVFDENGMMQRGVIVRHLLLPGHVHNAKKVVSYVYETYGDRVFLSLMNQYTPLPHVKAWPELDRRVTKREYDALVDYALSLGVENGFIQEGKTAQESFIPAFDYEGV